MSVKTRQNAAVSLEERGRLADLFTTAMTHIRANKRSERQVAVLNEALQLFLENRLGGVVKGGEVLDDEHLHRVLSLRLQDAGLPAVYARSYCNSLGVEYVGEAYLLPSRYRLPGTDRSRAMHVLLSELGLPEHMKLDEKGWTPPYASNPDVLALWAKPMHEFRRSNTCNGCKSVGTWLRELRADVRVRWHDKRIRACMYVPPSWAPPMHNHVVCRDYGTAVWDGEYLDADAVEKLYESGHTALASLSTIACVECACIVRSDQAMRVIEEAMKRRGIAFSASITAHGAASLSVEEFDFSVRTKNCFRSMNIRTLSDLLQKTEAELLKGPNFGRKSLNEIKDVLRPVGLKLKE